MKFEEQMRWIDSRLNELNIQKEKQIKALNHIDIDVVKMLYLSILEKIEEDVEMLTQIKEDYRNAHEDSVRYRSTVSHDRHVTEGRWSRWTKTLIELKI